MDHPAERVLLTLERVLFTLEDIYNYFKQVGLIILRLQNVFSLNLERVLFTLERVLLTVDRLIRVLVAL